MQMQTAEMVIVKFNSFSAYARGSKI